MRAAFLCLLVAAAGCGKPAPTEPAPAAKEGETPPAKRGAPKERAKPADPVPPGPPIIYGGEYEAGNPVEADLKYKGKRVTFRNQAIDRISRTKDGRPYVAPLSVLVVAPRVPEPCYYFFLKSDADAKGVKAGQVYDVTGVCRGYERDNFWRGNVPGMDWHVDVEDCVLVPGKK